MQVAIVEAQIVDHPEYETYIDTYTNAWDAIQFATLRLQEEMDECEGGVPTVKRLTPDHYRIDDGGVGGTVYFVTLVTPK